MADPLSHLSEIKSNAEFVGKPYIDSSYYRANAAGSALESAYLIENPTVSDITFSAAQLVAASLNFFDGATVCGGNNAAMALHYVHEKSISLDSTFPFPADFPTKFPSDPYKLAELEQNTTFRLKKDYTTYWYGKEGLLAALQIQPVVVNLAIDPQAFSSYVSGVVDDSFASVDVDHSVLLIGYDLVRNVWIVYFF